VGAVTRRPIAVGDEVRIASILKATLAVDHRVADGAQAGFFLQEFRKLLENPINFLAGYGSGVTEPSCRENSAGSAVGSMQVRFSHT